LFSRYFDLFYIYVKEKILFWNIPGLNVNFLCP
jgi:hypothetical protein